MNEFKSIDPADWQDWQDPARFSPKPYPRLVSEHQVIGAGEEVYPSEQGRANYLRNTGEEIDSGRALVTSNVGELVVNFAGTADEDSSPNLELSRADQVQEAFDRR